MINVGRSDWDMKLDSRRLKENPCMYFIGLPGRNDAQILWNLVEASIDICCGRYECAMWKIAGALSETKLRAMGHSNHALDPKTNALSVK